MATKTSFARWMSVGTLAAAGLLNVSVAAAAAAPPPPVPMTLTQQGRILDKDGAPVSSSVHFVFTVYNDPKSTKPANALWTEEQDITLDDGYFSAQLGSVTAFPDGLFDGSMLYIGVTVGNDAEMAPRQSVTSVPYAIRAGSAATADSVAFTSLSGLPAPCTDGMYLKGYSAVGVASCAALPTLNCVPRYNTVSNGTTATVGCSTGEKMTGGGCFATQALTASYQNTCVTGTASAASVPASGSATPAAVGPVQPPIIIPPIQFCLFGTNTDLWTCNTNAAATTIRAYAQCCKVE